MRARQSEENKRGAEESTVTGQYWRGTEPPEVCRSFTIVHYGPKRSGKILVHFVKSIIGSLCMSDCCSLASVEPFFENVLRPFYDQNITLKTLALRPTATLVELLRAQGCHSFDIRKEALGPTTRCQGPFSTTSITQYILIPSSLVAWSNSCQCRMSETILCSHTCLSFCTGLAHKFVLPFFIL